MNTKNKKAEKLIDADGKVLGRIATTIAMSLMGKDKVTFERNSYSGSPVRVVNASKIKITDKKLNTITHNQYSGYRGGLKTFKAKETIAKKGSSELIKLAVYRMLPSNKLRREMMKNLKIEE